jgi:hypothetical protein
MVMMVLALCALQSTAARAAERTDTVLLSVAAAAAEAAQLEAVARELLERLDMRVEMRRVERIDVAEIRQALGPEAAYFARVWIAFAPSGRARLYLEHGASDRVLVREVGGELNNPELVREELGHILQTAIEGLKAGEAIGAPRREALKDEPLAAKPIAAAPPPARAENARRSRVSWPRQSLLFSPRYELGFMGDDAHFQDGPGAALQAAFPLGFELAGYYRRPLQVSRAGVGARLQTISFRALPVLDVWRGARSGVRLGLGLGADLVRVSSFATPGTDVRLAPSRWRKLALARLQGNYARRLTSFMDLELGLGADLDLSDTRYVVQQAGGASSVLVPWRVRPFVALGARVP